jgi:hypothetical protein
VVQQEAADMGSGSNVTPVRLDGDYLRLCHPEAETSFEVVAGPAIRESTQPLGRYFVTPRSHCNGFSFAAPVGAWHSRIFLQ